MENQYFSLELHKSNKLTRIFQLVFGIICAAVAAGWLFINISSMKMTFSMWLTLLFLIGFAYFQVLSGLGKADKFIEISISSIRIKRNSVLLTREIRASEVDAIEIFPVSVEFFLKSGKKLTLRFGTTFTETIEPIKNALETFANLNNLSLRFREEEF